MERTIQELWSRNNPKRGTSVIALGEFREPAIEYLHQALEDDDKWVRYFASNALGNIGHHSFVDPLVRLLLDEDQDVRWVTAAALGRIGGPRAVRALRQAYNSDNAFVKLFIEKALDKLVAEEPQTPGMASIQG